MKSLFKFLILVLVVFVSCSPNQSSKTEQVQIAFMADVHLQDVYGELTDSDYKGLLHPTNGKHVLARTMKAQLSSTRLFNENYFAFLAALDDVAERGIKYVVMPGDFSDDGQPINVRGMKRILDEYSQKYGINFVVTTGNHDPMRPFSVDAGKKDFLGEAGKQQAIMSREGMYTPKGDDDHPVVISKDIRGMGYEEIIGTLDNFGFFPKQNDLYWETPFTSYEYADYDLKTALKQADFESRQYQLPGLESTVPDISYLVEPQEGLWFLALDANVYIPKDQAKTDPANPASYQGAGIGYKSVMTHKKHLIDWVKRVAERADEMGKTLITFSHYPMIDFNDDATNHIAKLLQGGQMQMHRIPSENVAKTFADAGIKIHFGGHMHINDTGIRNYASGKSLVNVQIPSLAAYIPAYKILTVKNRNLMEFETIILDSVPRFKELFPLYEREYKHLKESNEEVIWNKDVLSSASYHEYTNWHLKELTRLRFLKKDWPIEFRDLLLNSTGKDLLQFYAIDVSPDSAKVFESWTGFDLIFDLYRLRSADKLAFKDIGLERIKQYNLLIEAMMNLETNKSTLTEKVLKDFNEFANIFHHFMNGAPADHFQVDLTKGEILDLSK